ncbi:MAG: tRNA lysidine(34) synthetase TilS [Chiayiivirga sp.]|jgi:tRNA(Ile)-lysidine synthase|uniref:tRNA lysidine(34) synthetase TilS n=1 Tax=Chiayiivirga sp. TaxID=2041042 RepID=UPI0025C490A5|nr:tRNA lysidine(34) synthetase TilS [Chiayiivirga sp.]MCI1710101.1 tRNA lysidine(34) synthetase TilS [Chiayiivirga sp.]MCI1729100.1 tRNA lysidine(34) synthetase TilS [Chiayiivirga sp.]
MNALPLTELLATRLRQLPPGPLRVGFSGGLDSTVLLHALASLPVARERGLAAIHVDHGLHPDSPLWTEHCRRFCVAIGVPMEQARVKLVEIDQLGLEAAARSARHAVFASLLPGNGLLALAHHRDDQTETLLLRLLHGAGHEGLAGMRMLRPFAAGSLWRPWLDVARDDLRAHAEAHALGWIEDPGNANPQHARNYLRHAVLPILAGRWPDASRRIAATATRLREESDLLQTAATEALAQAQGVDPGTVSLAALRAQPAALRRLVIGRWLDQLGLPRPPPGVWTRIEPDLIAARVDAAPRLAWRGAELRRYRDTLFAMLPLPATQHDWELSWDGTTRLHLPPGFGNLELQPAMRMGPVTVRPRLGGERLQQAGAHRELRTLLQDLGVPPWVRERLPLLFDQGGQLLAAADLAASPAFVARLQAAGTRLRWQVAPTASLPSD